MMRTILEFLRSLFCGGRSGEHANSSRGDVKQGRTDDSQKLMERRNRRHAVNAAYEKLIQHLDEHDVSYMTRDENQSICADFRGKAGMYRIVAQVDDDDDLFQVVGFAPVRIQEGSRPAIVETITRANFGLRVGKFEMNPDDGELRFHAAQILTHGCLDDAVIERMMGTTVAMLDMYLPAVLSVIYGNELPQDAVKCVEAGLV